MSDLHTRDVLPLSVADAGELFTLQLAAWVREGRENGTFDIPPLLDSAADVVTQLLDPDWRIWGLRHSGRLVATVRSQVLPAGVSFIGRLGVVPDLRGHGLGSLMLRFAESQCSPETTRIELVTGSLSVSNHLFYGRHGYALVGRDDPPGTVRFGKRTAAHETLS